MNVFTEDMLTSGKRVEMLVQQINCMVAGKPVPVFRSHGRHYSCVWRLTARSEKGLTFIDKINVLI